MCGLFGAIGTTFSVDKVRALALINEKRGDDALGLFDATGKSIKYADNPYKCLGRKDFTGFMKNAKKRSWFLAGHTRAASFRHGGNLTAHAHPFRYGKTIGAHNGYTPREWKDKDKWPVDSMILIEALDEHKSDYQTALANFEGYWGLTWLDGYTDTLYLSTRDNEIALCRFGDNYYYSSDVKHLTAGIGSVESYWEIKDGMTVAFQFVDGQVQIKWCDKFVPNTEDWKTTKTQRASGGVGYAYYNNRSGGTTYTPSTGTAGNTSAADAPGNKGGSGVSAPCGFRVPTIYQPGKEEKETETKYQKDLWEREACCVCQDRVAESEQIVCAESGDIYCRDCGTDFNIEAWARYQDSRNTDDPNDPFHFDEDYVASKDTTCKSDEQWLQEWEDAQM